MMRQNTVADVIYSSERDPQERCVGETRGYEVQVKGTQFNRLIWLGLKKWLYRVLKREWTNEYACHTHVTMSIKCCFLNLLIQWELGDTGKVVIGGVYLLSKSIAKIKGKEREKKNPYHQMLLTVHKMKDWCFFLIL